MKNVLIVGAGAIAPAHIEAYLAFPERARIGGIANPTVSKASGLVERYGLDCAVGSDFRELLNDADVVSICSPPAAHREIAVAALVKGKHVLLEKPMAPSLEDCDAILHARKSSGACLSVVAQSRFISSISRVINTVKSAEFGRLLFSQINSFWYRGQSYYNPYWRGVWKEEGGGCTLNHGVHHIDLLLWAAGMPESVNSVIANLNHDNSEEEDISLSNLRFPDGGLGQINCSLVHHGEMQKLDFVMESGNLSIPTDIKVSKSRENGFPMDDEESAAKTGAVLDSMPAPAHQHHEGQVEDLLDAIDTGRQPLVTGQDGKNAIELITGIYKSGITGETVEFPIESSDSYYTFTGRVAGAPRFNVKTRSTKGFEDSTITSFKGKF